MNDNVRTLPAARLRAINAALVVAGTLLMAIGAHVSVNVPFSPVPITGQTLALPLVVALLGTRRSVAAMFLYLAEGAMGLPVFAPSTLPGAIALIGPTAGYLWAFPIAAYVVGALFDLGLSQRFAGRAVSVFAGEVAVFALGALWLAHFVGLDRAAALGIAPFVVGDTLKIALAAAVGGSVSRALPALLRG